MVLILAMIAFYASTFDAITLVVAGYSEKDLTGEKEPRKKLRAFWSCVFSPAADRTAVFGEYALQPADDIHHCGVSARNHHDF